MKFGFSKLVPTYVLELSQTEKIPAEEYSYEFARYLATMLLSMFETLEETDQLLITLSKKEEIWLGRLHMNPLDAHTIRIVIDGTAYILKEIQDKEDAADE